MDKELRLEHPAKRLVFLTVASVLDTAEVVETEVRPLLEVAVAEVFHGQPSHWSVETLEKLLGDPRRLEQIAAHAGLGTDAASIDAVRGMVEKYRERQRIRFGCSAPTPLWPWLDINMVCSRDLENYECPHWWNCANQAECATEHAE